MTDLQPCSPCREGNHDTCEATGNPFCGCRKAEHHGALAGPIVAPIADVLAAGQRAPQPEVAQLPATPEGAPAAPAASAAALLGAASTPSLADQVMAQLAPIIGSELPEVGPLEADDEPDDAPPIDIPDRGQAGLPDPAPAPEPSPTAPVAPEVPASGAPSLPTYDSIPMVAERDPALYASVWDSHQAHFAEELPAVGYDPDPNQDAIEDAQDFGPEHAYAGTPEAPYACACGATPASLNKLGSHLGIVADVDAMAELAKATVPNQLAQEPAPEVPAQITEEQVAEALDALPEGALEAMVADAMGIANPLGPEAIAKALEELPEPETDIVTAGPEPRTLAELEAAGELDIYKADPPPDLIDTEPTPEDADVRTMAALADDIRELLEGSVSGMSLMAADTPWRLVLVNGDTGMVWEALYDDDQLPTAVADNLLEHFGFRPSPIDADHPPVAAPPRPAPMPVVVGGGMGALPGPDTTRPTRIQVARITTECGACHVPIEPGEAIGFFPGTGWRHLTHA